jgi:hypothetical protein
MFHRLAQTTAASEANTLMRLQLQQQQEHAADEARAASHANELTRIQLQLQLAQQTAASSTARILQQQQALSVLGTLSLNAEQAKKKQRMETDLAAMCFAIADAPNTLDAIADSLNGMAPYPPPRSVVSTAARPAQAHNRAAGGGASNLHPQFNAAAHASNN